MDKEITQEEYYDLYPEMVPTKADVSEVVNLWEEKDPDDWENYTTFDR